MGTEDAALAQEAEQLWQTALVLINQFPSLRDEVLSLCEECAPLLDQGSDDGHPERMAEYLVIQGLQVRFMDRAADLLNIFNDINARNQQVDASRKMEEFFSAFAAVEDPRRNVALFPEAVAPLKADVDTIRSYLP